MQCTLWRAGSTAKLSNSCPQAWRRSQPSLGCGWRRRELAVPSSNPGLWESRRLLGCCGLPAGHATRATSTATGKTEGLVASWKLRAGSPVMPNARHWPLSHRVHMTALARAR